VTGPGQISVVEVDDYLRIDFEQRKVAAGGKEIKLRPTEYRLLRHLVSNAGRLLTHENLLSKVWGPEYRDEDHYVRLYVTYLRQKIERDPKNPEYILSERGLGYRFKELNRG
jgi:two-component system KDP operon response regulator KdpE